MSYEGNSADGKHYWLTPPELMESLQREFNFDFDACPYPRPDDFDGLTADWGSSSYVNPPFHGPTAWVRKAIAESQKGKRVVFVFPIDKWIHLLLEAGAQVRNLRDVKWCSTEDGKPGKGTGRHIACFILGGETTTNQALSCPKHGTNYRDDCKLCCIAKDCAGDTRADLFTLVLKWHDAFYAQHDVAQPIAPKGESF